MKISLVIPVYNEVESVPHLHQAIREALAGRDYEVVYVDDGSTDGSVEALERLVREDGGASRVVVLRRNFGQTAALAAGIDHSSGEVIVTLDADLQNDPADIPALMQKIDEGYDVVSGWRVDRQDAALTRRLPSQIANWIISRVTGVRLHDYGCTLKAYRREVLEGFHLYGEMHRFIPAYAGGVGARIVEVPVRHHARRYGRAKYGLERTLKVILDLFTVKFLTSYAAKPIYIFGGTGMGMIAASLVVLVALAVRRLTLDEHMIRSPLLLLSVMLFILGAQAILMGLLAELTVRTYHESQAKPTYSVRRVVDAAHGTP
ncbi:MAG TPA: glycosyltransferase family 2 protein [Anaerolineales bacterium]|nr:glycosyltransferase family 2 protein [Anaerolineales bacterium]